MAEKDVHRWWANCIVCDHLPSPHSPRTLGLFLHQMAVSSSLKTRFSGAILTLILIDYIFFRYHSSSDHGLVANFTNYRKDPSLQQFVSQALQHQVSDPFNISTLSNLCQNRRPRDDVIVVCKPGTGGVGNIRSYILHCTRFAIEAGASMHLPDFYRRSRSDLSELKAKLGDFEHFFDRAHFIDTIQKACPHMKVYQSMQAEWTWGNMEIPHWPLAINFSTPQEPSPWRQNFDKWFDNSTAELKKPFIVVSRDPGRNRAVMDDGEDLYYNIGRILQFRPDARRLAALCMGEMSRRFSLHLDPKQNLYTAAYLGAHLRTSSDAVKVGWNPDFEEQTDWYINPALAHNLSVIYTAGGNDADFEPFAVKAFKKDVYVVNKFDLLFDNDLQELHNFVWDQRGLVDFEFLLKASQ